MSGAGGEVEIEVHGGPGGVHARYDDLALLAGVLAALAHDLGDAAWADKAEAFDGDLVASAPLSPGTFAAAEAAILEATYGPRGLVAGVVEVEAHALAVTAVVEVYRAADAAREAATEALAWSLGAVVGAHLPELLVLGGATVLALDAVGGRPGVRATRLVERHPVVVETLVDGGGGLLDGLALDPVTGPLVRALGIRPFHADTAAAAADLGRLLFGRYRGELDPGYDGPRFEHASPTSLADLVGSLRETAEEEVPDGVFTVQRLTREDGSCRWVVQLPGTDSFTEDRVVRNLGGNLALVAGEDTAYGEAVRLALARAGAGREDPVLLVGHSQGGMQAVALAADPDPGFRITYVVTVGSPVATGEVPSRVHVVSLENTGDLVPLLDGEPNPDRAHHTTLRAEILTGQLGASDGDNHSLAVYADLADAADRSADPAVRSAIDRLREGGFLDGEAVDSRTTTFRAVPGEEVRAADIGRGR